MQMISAIEQHIGSDPVTGRRTIQLHEVVTKIDVGDAATARIGDLHAVEVELALLDAEPRAGAEAWLAKHAAQIDISNRTAWIRRAIEAFTTCARCHMQPSGEDGTRTHLTLIDQGWRRMNPLDATAGMGLQWICSGCWTVLIQRERGVSRPGEEEQ